MAQQERSLIQIIQGLQRFKPDTELLQRNRVMPINSSIVSFWGIARKEFSRLVRADEDNSNRLIPSLTQTYGPSRYEKSPQFIEYWHHVTGICLDDRAVCEDIGVNFASREGNERAYLQTLLLFENYQRANPER